MGMMVIAIPWELKNVVAVVGKAPPVQAVLGTHAPPL